MDSNEFLHDLLDRTLNYVINNVPFYRDLSYLKEKGSSLTLEDFPIIDKNLIAKDLQKFLVMERFPDYVISTGGTSGGAPNITFRIEEEYYAVHEYLTGFTPGRFPELDSIKEFVIDIFFNTNGYYWRKASGWPILSLALEQPAHAEVIRNLIQEGLVVNDRKIPARRIQSQNGPLRTLTGYFWVREFFPRDFGIKSVVCYGSHISRVWRERLQELWGPNILTVYGLTEFGIGNALECSYCGGYHYRTAWPEFLALDKSGPVTKGDAFLVLTSLVPFVRVQPRIRYLTGDLVTVLGLCEKTNQIGFRFRGRAESSAIAYNGKNNEVLFSELEVIEVLDQLPDIGSRIHPSELQLWADSDLPHPPFRMGFPRFKIKPPSITQDTKKIEIAIETSFNPSVKKERAKDLREQFIKTLHADFPHLLDRLDAFETTLDVKLLPSGSLKLRTKASA